MIKKLSLALVAVAVIAFAVPAFASATAMTLPAGTLVPVGTATSWTSHNLVVKTNMGGNVACVEVVLDAKITKNNGVTVEGVDNGGSFAKECFFAGKNIEVTMPTLRSFVSGAGGKGTVSIIFVADLPGGFKCTYEETAMPYTFTVGASTLKMAGALKVTPAACGTATLEAEFTVEKTGGGFIILD